MNALRQLLEQLQAGKPLSGDELVALGLVMTMLASAAHLFTMVITRWGDRNTAIKALLGSLLIHSVCFLGLEVFVPPTAAASDTTPELPPEDEITIEALVESDRDVSVPQSGNTAQLDAPSRSEIPLERLDAPTPIFSQPMTPERTADPTESMQVDAEDLTQYESREITEIAPLVDAGVEGRRQVATTDPAAELQTQYEVSQADVMTEQIERLKPRPGRDDSPESSTNLDRPATAPRHDFAVTAADRSPAAEFSASEDAVKLPPRMDSTEVVERPAAPNDNQTLIDSAVTTNPQPRSPPVAAMTFQSRLPRNSRSRPDASPSMRPTRTTDQIARTPLPLSSDYEDVRLGVVSPEFADALVSSAENTALTLPEISRRSGPPPAYRLRGVQNRADAARQFGGTQESEDAVERSLRWLASVQSADGRWDASQFDSGQVKLDENGVDRDYAGRDADTGITALVVLSFLGAGYTHEEGKYALEVDHALEWLIRQQDQDGSLFGNARHYAGMYCHGMATYALAEAWAMQGSMIPGPIVDPLGFTTGWSLSESALSITSALAVSQPLLGVARLPQEFKVRAAGRVAENLRRVSDSDLRSALTRAVNFTIGYQDPTGGGWRYRRGQSGDISMLGWQLMAIKSAELAGIGIPPVVRTRMSTFLDQTAQGAAGGLFGYRRTTSSTGVRFEPPTPTMTAEALFCRQMLGSERESGATREALGFLVRNPPRISQTNYYYWYYASLAMFQQGGPAWTQWNRMIRELLVDTQVVSGQMAGSWAPNDPWGRYGGRLYSTALATLTLEVYYRFLPLYQLGRGNDVTSGSRP